MEVVYIPTRGDGPRRFGEGVQHVPDVGPSNLDARVYTDPDRYELERTRVLRQSWIIGGRSEEIPESGDHLLYEGHGEAVALVRQTDGTIAGFHNVCQHRGTRVVCSGGKAAKGFVCPWHGWAYGLDGKLRGVPDRGDFSEDQLRGLRAPPVAVEEWGGWIWMFLAGPDEAPPLSEWLGEVGDELARYRMEDMFVFEKCVWDVPCNYKAVVDGFNEAYHISALHKVPPIAARAARETSYAILGRNSMMVVPMDPSDVKELTENGNHMGTVTCHYVVFPTAVFNNLPNHLQLFLPVPIGPHATRFECWELHYRNGDDAYRKDAEAAWKFLKPIVEQDVFIFNELAHTQQSMGYERNRFNDRECKPTAYHQEMARMVGDDFAPELVPKLEAKGNGGDR